MEKIKNVPSKGTLFHFTDFFTSINYIHSSELRYWHTGFLGLRETGTANKAT